MSDTPKDAGVLLKQERERKGISLDVVHETTKIPMDALKAIEEGYKVRTLSAFYYKSFVKIYAQYLGLDASAVVALVPTHHPKPVIAAAAVHPGSTRVSSSSGTGAHKVEGVRSWNLLSHPIVLKKKKRVLRTVIMVAVAVIGIIVVAGIVRKVSMTVAANRALDKVERAKAKPLAKTPVKKAAVVPVRVEASAPQAVPSGTVVDDEKQAKPVARVAMTVRAQTSTWIRVWLDGSGVFQGLLKKGSSETWHGVKKIELSAKDIGALEFEVNGKNIGKVAKSDVKAKRLVVTSEGFVFEK